jgi:hypothetical protein
MTTWNTISLSIAAITLFASCTKEDARPLCPVEEATGTAKQMQEGRFIDEMPVNDGDMPAEYAGGGQERPDVPLQTSAALEPAAPQLPQASPHQMPLHPSANTPQGLDAMVLDRIEAEHLLEVQ